MSLKIQYRQKALDWRGKWIWLPILDTQNPTYTEQNPTLTVNALIDVLHLKVTIRSNTISHCFA